MNNLTTAVTARVRAIIREVFMETQLKYPQWQEPLQDVILEICRPDFSTKLDSAKGAILKRFLLWTNTNSAADEREALRDALATIRTLK